MYEGFRKHQRCRHEHCAVTFDQEPRIHHRLALVIRRTRSSCDPLPHPGTAAHLNVLACDVAKLIAGSIISSRLDYCNFLFVVMSEANFSKLHLVQNTIARFVTRTKRYDHVKREVTYITSVLATLHWLPVKSRGSLQLATLVYNIRQCEPPFYLASLSTDYNLIRNLRSSSLLLPDFNRPLRKNFRKGIPSLGRRGMELSSVDSQRVRYHRKFKKKTAKDPSIDDRP